MIEICAEIRNWFCEDSDKHYGKFTIENGNIVPSDFLLYGQYYRIKGSALNDGIYQHGNESLRDEEFEGAVWAMRIPPSVIEIAEEIKEYETKNPNNGFSGESWGGYSYTKKEDSSWQSVFRRRLNPWRKL